MPCNSCPNYNRVSYTLPNFAMPYNAPVQPDLFISRWGGLGTVYRTASGTFGNCDGSAMPPYDFICPVSRMCYSQTSNLVGYTANDICRNIRWARRPLQTCQACQGCCNL